MALAAENTVSNISTNLSLNSTISAIDLDIKISKCDSCLPQYIIIGVLGILGICGNVISLFAIVKVGKSTLSANMRLVISLCISDILTSVSVILYFVIEHNVLDSGHLDISENNLKCVSVALRGFRMFTHIISLFNIGGLAADNYSSLVWPLQYPVTSINNRVTRIILIFWVIAFLLGFSKFFLPVALPSYCQNRTDLAYCERVYCSQYDSEYIVFLLSFVALIGMLGTYVVIFSKLRGPFISHEMYRHQRRNRRGILTTVLIVITFMVCWLPYCIFEVTLMLRIRYSSDLSFMKNFRLFRDVGFYLYDLLLLNSILDPLIYAKRLTEVRTGYRYLRKTFVECNHQNNEGSGDNLISTQLLLRENNSHSNAQSRKASQTTTRSLFSLQ